jgi:hypothetical protein
MFAEAVVHAGECKGVAYYPKAGGHCFDMVHFLGVFSLCDSDGVPARVARRGTAMEAAVEQGARPGRFAAAH